MKRVQIRQPAAEPVGHKRSGFKRKGTQFVQKEDLPPTDTMVHFEDDHVAKTRKNDFSNDRLESCAPPASDEEAAAAPPQPTSFRKRLTLQRKATAFARRAAESSTSEDQNSVSTNEDLLARSGGHPNANSSHITSSTNSSKQKRSLQRKQTGFVRGGDDVNIPDPNLRVKKTGSPSGSEECPHVEQTTVGLVAGVTSSTPATTAFRGLRFREQTPAGGDDLTTATAVLSSSSSDVLVDESDIRKTKLQRKQTGFVRGGGGVEGGFGRGGEDTTSSDEEGVGDAAKEDEQGLDLSRGLSKAAPTLLQDEDPADNEVYGTVGIKDPTSSASTSLRKGGSAPEDSIRCTGSATTASAGVYYGGSLACSEMRASGSLESASGGPTAAIVARPRTDHNTVLFVTESVARQKVETEQSLLEYKQALEATRQRIVEKQIAKLLEAERGAAMIPEEGGGAKPKQEQEVVGNNSKSRGGESKALNEEVVEVEVRYRHFHHHHHLHHRKWNYPGGGRVDHPTPGSAPLPAPSTAASASRSPRFFEGTNTPPRAAALLSDNAVLRGHTLRSRGQAAVGLPAHHLQLRENGYTAASVPPTSASTTPRAAGGSSLGTSSRGDRPRPPPTSSGGDQHRSTRPGAEAESRRPPLVIPALHLAPYLMNGDGTGPVPHKGYFKKMRFKGFKTVPFSMTVGDRRARARLAKKVRRMYQQSADSTCEEVDATETSTTTVTDAATSRRACSSSSTAQHRLLQEIEFFTAGPAAAEPAAADVEWGTRDREQQLLLKRLWGAHNHRHTHTHHYL